MPNSKLKEIKAWAGIVNGKIFAWKENTIHVNPYQLEIYTTRKAAKQNCEEVIPVIIKPMEKNKNGKRTSRILRK